MRITRISIPKSDGLEDIKMDKLGDIVLIAGKNGSGKTRILDKISSVLKKKPKPSQIEDYKAQKYNLLENLKAGGSLIWSMFSEDNSFTEKINKLLHLEYYNEYADELKVVIQTLEESSIPHKDLDKKLSYASDLNKLQSKINWDLIITSELSENYDPIKFVPKQINLSSASLLPRFQMLAKAKNLDKVGVNHLYEGTLAKIQVIQDAWFNATHPESQISDVEKQQAINDYEKLKEYIEIFLDIVLSRNINGDATLFGFPIGEAQLSDGQIVLLQFCLAIYSQETALKDLILVMDEPENHLHPSIIIEVIDRIRQCVTNGQIWIATHSIPLLAHFDPSCIWYVENGSIKHAGKIPEKVLSSLLGGEDNIAKLQDFISLPAQYATIRYAFECLFEPAVVMTGYQDPQTRQIRENLWHLAKDGKIKILDYGAGKGRLLSNIVEADEQNEEKLLDKINYIAFDKFPDDKEYCENTLTKAYGSAEKRYFNDITTLLTHHDNGSFQVIIMCNVLHEIEPYEWLALFEKNGTLSSLLAENGVLLLVEDQQIPTGEKAYQKGFLVLDTPQLKDLFNISSNNEDFIVHDFRQDGRLKAHIIPKKFLETICSESRKKAIDSLANMAKGKISNIRKDSKNYQNGKLHGFWTQQFANAQLVLETL